MGGGGVSNGTRFPCRLAVLPFVCGALLTAVWGLVALGLLIGAVIGFADRYLP